MTTHVSEPGSYRDRNGRVMYRGDSIVRGLSAYALSQWEAVSTKGFFRRAQADGRIVGTRRIDADSIADWSVSNDWSGYLEHDRIPFVSYPYEWSFSMLRDAGLLQLELAQASLEEGMILKDASSYNVQWRGSQPVFIDIPSFEEIRPGEAWTGYRQFCELVLYPLFLQTYKDVPFQPWLRGRLDGVLAEELASLMSTRDMVRPGVFMHVYLQAKLQARYSRSERNVNSELSSAGFNLNLIRTNLRNMTKLVKNLQWKRSQSSWSNYATKNSYSDADRDQKVNFVHDIVREKHRSMVWDIGCNTGTFSRIASHNADYVLAMDSDHLSIDLLYRALAAENNRNILPLVVDITDPSPRLGWRLLERKALPDRGAPDLVLCLALIHHVVIGANVPMAEFIQWLADLGGDIVIEFVAKDDEMVKGLLRNKPDVYDDYEEERFEAALSHHYAVLRRQALPSGTRVLYFATPRH